MYAVGAVQRSCVAAGSLVMTSAALVRDGGSGEVGEVGEQGTFGNCTLCSILL